MVHRERERFRIAVRGKHYRHTIRQWWLRSCTYLNAVTTLLHHCSIKLLPLRLSGGGGASEDAPEMAQLLTSRTVNVDTAEVRHCADNNGFVVVVVVVVVLWGVVVEIEDDEDGYTSRSQEAMKREEEEKEKERWKGRVLIPARRRSSLLHAPLG